MYSHESLPDGAAVGADPSRALASRRPSASAGFGSPGADATVKRIDLNDALIRHPQAPFVMRAAGAAMQGAGIDDGDVLLVDRALQPSPGNIIIAIVNGELTCWRLWQQAGNTRLQAASEEDTDIAAILSFQVRDKDLPARWADHEFVILFDDVAEQLAGLGCERIRAVVESFDCESVASGLRISVSIGLSEFRVGDTAESVVHRSDESMYRAKSVESTSV
jgi:DNA polymerase V